MNSTNSIPPTTAPVRQPQPHMGRMILEPSYRFETGPPHDLDYWQSNLRAVLTLAMTTLEQWLGPKQSSLEEWKAPPVHQGPPSLPPYTSTSTSTSSKNTQARHALFLRYPKIDTLGEAFLAQVRAGNTNRLFVLHRIETGWDRLRAKDDRGIVPLPSDPVQFARWLHRTLPLRLRQQEFFRQRNAVMELSEFATPHHQLPSESE